MGKSRKPRRSSRLNLLSQSSTLERLVRGLPGGDKILTQYRKRYEKKSKSGFENVEK